MCIYGATVGGTVDGGAWTDGGIGSSCRPLADLSANATVLNLLNELAWKT